MSNDYVIRSWARPSDTIPSMPRVNGKRFACEFCGVTVFGKAGNLFWCNGCNAVYEGTSSQPQQEW